MLSINLIFIIGLFGFIGANPTPSLSSDGSGFKLTPPENAWTRNGEKVVLLCRADRAIRTCSWITPYGKNYVFGEGLKAEGGRIEFFQNSEDECGVIITEIDESKDIGKWSCNLNIVEDQEIKSAQGLSSVRIATVPNRAKLMLNSTYLKTSLTTGQKTINCSVQNANPKPDFRWMIGDQEISESNVMETIPGNEKGEWIESLLYTPLYQHANKSLKCLVSHPGLDEDLQDSVEIQVMEDGFKNTIPIITREFKEFRTKVILGVGIVLGLFVLVLVTILIVRKMGKLPILFDDVYRENPETPQSSENPKEEEDNENIQEEKSTDTTNETPQTPEIDQHEVSNTVEKFLTKLKFGNNGPKNSVLEINQDETITNPDIADSTNNPPPNNSLIRSLMQKVFKSRSNTNDSEVTTDESTDEVEEQINMEEITDNETKSSPSTSNDKP